MIRDVSKNDWHTNQEIISLVGKPFSFEESRKIRGIGIPKFNIIEASESINQLLLRGAEWNTCHVELRPGGLLIRFNSIQNTMAWAIPFFKLNAYAFGNELSLHADTDYIRLKNHYSLKQNNEFMKKLRDLRNHYIARAMVEN